MAYEEESHSAGRRSGASDLLIPPGSYAYFQAMTTGAVSTKVGPNSVQPGGQEKPVEFNPVTRQFQECGREDSVKQNVWADESSYIVLENPCETDQGLVSPNSSNDRTPEKGLSIGSKVVVQGPTSFALWPGQIATVIQGHSLKSNQYLELVVRDPEEAKKNWSAATLVATPPSGNEEIESEGPSVAEQVQSGLTMGQRLIIRGTDASFYMPSTGIEVMANSKNEFVREAVTLERLDYCILVDEDGNKRYERGPAVVFPEPTERFVEDKGTRKFR